MTSVHKPAGLTHSAFDLIGGAWVPIPGDRLVSCNPAAPDRVVYTGTPQPAHVGLAIAAARKALPAWAGLGIEGRAAVLRRYAELTSQHAGRIADLICDEVGKAMWEARAEAAGLAAKVEITLDQVAHGGRARVGGFELTLSPTRSGRCQFRPHGVMAVLGPFNFPAHLPNGHIVPALMMGNTVVFKPSDRAPGVGQLVAELFDDALRDALGPGYVPGVVNLVQGGAQIAEQLVAHEGIDAIAFTGSWAVGRRILEANLDRPGRMIALELGGSNPAIVMPDADMRAAAIEIARSAFSTTGQRCTCTRRAIVHRDAADRLIPAVCKAASNLIFTDPRATHPVFAGPLNNEPALRRLLAFQDSCARRGAAVLVPAVPIQTPTRGHYASASVVRVERFVAEPAAGPDPDPGCDEEVFGPLLRVAVVGSLDEAIEQANATRYGLAASIFTRDGAAAARFLAEVRAGCLNVNTGTAGASSKLPFGGLGLSGNHRPAGSFASDYCAYPVASMHEHDPAAGATLPAGMRFDDSWVS